MHRSELAMASILNIELIETIHRRSTMSLDVNNSIDEEFQPAH